MATKKANSREVKQFREAKGKVVDILELTVEPDYYGSSSHESFIV